MSSPGNVLSGHGGEFFTTDLASILLCGFTISRPFTPAAAGSAQIEVLAAVADSPPLLLVSSQRYIDRFIRYSWAFVALETGVLLDKKIVLSLQGLPCFTAVAACPC